MKAKEGGRMVPGIIEAKSEKESSCWNCIKTTITSMQWSGDGCDGDKRWEVCLSG